jgi:hypothetical protein
MNSTNRLPHAASTPLPELAAFLTPLHTHFLRSEGRHLLERYVTGVLSEHPNKNCDTLAQIIPGTSEQSLQNLLTTMRWDDTAVNRSRCQMRARVCIQMARGCRFRGIPCRASPNHAEPCQAWPRQTVPSAVTSRRAECCRVVPCRVMVAALCAASCSVPCRVPWRVGQ